MDYVKLHINLNDASFRDILEAELGELPYDSFESSGPLELSAYIPSDAFIIGESEAILKAYAEHIADYQFESIEHQNWNAVWESGYEPVTIGDLFIGASFHERPSSAAHHITLDPNMSFGTGHHPTTHLMIERMMEMDLEGKRILDFGAGSAILSIYAGLMGASGIGIEIDAHAADAARKNLELNNIDSFKMITGDIESVEAAKFDIILANINRNVIEECLPTFKDRLAHGGHLLCSGFYETDIDALTPSLKKHGFEIEATMERSSWALIATKLP